MTNEEIRELLALFNDSDVAEMEVQRGENRVRFRRAPLNHEYAVAGAPGQLFHPQSATVIPVSPAVLTPSSTTTHPLPPSMAGKHSAESLAERDEVVKSPIVGTFYESASPGSAPFVKVGDTVEKGQVLCIIESMKLMNEIESEVAGTLVAKLVENGRPVEYGEGLFLIKPR
jgi:acetyl-CoA carboxylase biotin carboxyl carrier protein